MLTTGTAVGEIINVDNTAQRVRPGELCGAEACETSRTGERFDCDALLADPPLPDTAAFAGVDVRLNVPFFRDFVNVLLLALSGPITLTPTPTPTATAPPATPSPAHTPTATDTPTAIVPANCAGDCNANRAVGIEELIRGVNIALGLLALDTCAAIDLSGDGTVAVNELIQAVNAAANGC